MYGEIILQLSFEVHRDLPRIHQHSVGMLKVTKRNPNVRSKYTNSDHA